MTEPSGPVLGVSLHSASLLHGGRRHPLGSDELTLGREEDNDVVLTDSRASRHHARIHLEDGGFWITDLGSRHGSTLNGERLRGGARRLENGDTIAIGDEVLRFLSGQETRFASGALPVLTTQVVRFAGDRLTIGRDPHNDVVLEDPNVSRFHAEALRRDGAVEIVDLGSRNGTRADGAVVEHARLDGESDVGIGPYRLTFDGESVLARDDHGTLRLDARAVAVVVKDKEILEPTTVSLVPGELVVLIGESGAGKSTLLKVLAGVNRPSGGSVAVNGEPVLSRLTDIGYVPQDEIVHPDLTVREALQYAARLRLPDDSSAEDIESNVARVLGELSLEEHANTRIGSLSGGQRKRTGVAVELLSRPSLLFLDEPTTGLDPGLETRMMMLLRELADNARSVTVVTHATKNLALCDRVVVMGRGGRLVFEGAPADALGFFGVDDYDGIYTALDATPAAEWAERFHAQGDAASEDGHVEPQARERPPLPLRRQLLQTLSQTKVLTSRYVKVVLRDRRNLLLLVGQAPLLALAGVALFKSGLFDRPDGRPLDAVQMLFLMALTVIWLGSIDAAREIVKERSVVQREAAVGMRLSAYLTSKTLVLFALAAVQTLLYAGVLLAFRPLEGSGTTLTVLGVLLVTSFVGVWMGLLVSSVVGNEDQAMSLIPLMIIPQLLFAGAIVPTAGMGAIAEAISNIVFARWAFQTIGSLVDMGERLAEDPQVGAASPYGTDFFDLSAGPGTLVLLGFMLLFVVAVAVTLRRRLAA